MARTTGPAGDIRAPGKEQVHEAGICLSSLLLLPLVDLNMQGTPESVLPCFICEPCGASAQGAVFSRGHSWHHTDSSFQCLPTCPYSQAKPSLQLLPTAPGWRRARMALGFACPLTPHPLLPSCVCFSQEQR